MREKLKRMWEDGQKIIDLHGDTWLGLFTLFVLVRILAVLKGYPPLTAGESGAYSMCIGAFAYSNKGKP